MKLDINPLLLKAPEYPMVILEKLKEKRLAEGQPVYDFGTGDPQIPLESFLNQALVDGLPPIPQYPKVKGEPELLQAISDYLQQQGLSIEPHNILPTSGSKEAIYHVYPLLLHAASKRKGVIYPDPGYPVYSGGALYHGGVLYPQQTGPETHYQIDLALVPQEQLQNSCLAWICNPHNPTGAVGDLSWLTRQLKIAKEHDLVLCVDECYYEIYRQEPPPSILSLGLQGILAFHSLSKRSGFTAYRSGFVTGDPELVNLLKKMRPHFGVASQTFVQKMAVAAWRDTDHVRKRQQIFNERREVAVDFLKHNKFSFSGHDATFYLWIRLPSRFSDEQEYCRLLFENIGLLASPGIFFGQGGKGHIRLALVPGLDQTKQAFSLWQKLIDSGELPAGV